MYNIFKETIVFYFYSDDEIRGTLKLNESQISFMRMNFTDREFPWEKDFCLIIL